MLSSEFDLLNNIKYLYLRDVSEPRDNSLRVVVQEAVANPLGALRADRPELAEIMKDASPIESTGNCKTFELFWKRYAAYLVSEECVGSCGDFGDESYEGTLFRIYMKSQFLDHLARDTGGHAERLQHYKLICLNHIIDVASHAPPEIQIHDPTPKPPTRIQ